MVRRKGTMRLRFHLLSETPSEKAQELIEYIARLERENDRLNKLVLNLVSNALGSAAAQLLVDNGLAHTETPYEPGVGTPVEMQPGS